MQFPSTPQYDYISGDFVIDDRASVVIAHTIEDIRNIVRDLTPAHIIVDSMYAGTYTPTDPPGYVSIPDVPSDPSSPRAVTLRNGDSMSMSITMSIGDATSYSALADDSNAVPVPHTRDEFLAESDRRQRERPRRHWSEWAVNGDGTIRMYRADGSSYIVGAHGSRGVFDPPHKIWGTPRRTARP